MLKKHVLLVAWVVLSGVACMHDMDDEDIATSVDALTNVTWMNAVGVTEDTNSLTKSGTNVAWDAGAASNETLAGDGYVEFTTAETTTYKMAGLSNGDTDVGYADIDFAFYLRGTGTFAVYENGVYRGGFGAYSAGDTFRIETFNNVVTYKRNGASVYTSGVTPTFPLLVDTSLRTPNATVNTVVIDVLLAPPYWQNEVGVLSAQNDLSKSGTNIAWDAGASSMDSFSGDGYVEFTTAEATSAKMAGLSNGDTDVSFADIDYAFNLRNNGRIGIREGGVSRGSFFANYIAGDIFRIEVVSDVVTYKHNDVVLYVSGLTPTYPLLLDTSLRTPNSTVNDAVVDTIAFWQNGVNVTESNNDVTKAHPALAWNAGVSTVGSISTDGACSFTSGEATTSKMAGLSNGDTDVSTADIDFAIYLRDNGRIGVRENGVSKGSNFGTYIAGDTLSVAVAAGEVTYKLNDVVFYTSLGTPTFPLLCDVSLRNNGATINDVVIQ